jgi:uncharacterized low-complexity protein
MRIRKSLISMLALALVVAFSSLAKLQAASLADPGLRQSAGQLVTTVKATKGHKTMARAGKRHHHHHVASKGPGSCGTYMYYSGKSHKCMDARNK